jgi:hypothetical protein
MMREFSGAKFSRFKPERFIVLACGGVLVLATAMLITRKPPANFPMALSQVQETPHGIMSLIPLKPNSSNPKRVCFTRGAWIWVANLDTGKETRIVEGGNADISPSGDSLVFVSANVTVDGELPLGIRNAGTVLDKRGYFATLN